MGQLNPEELEAFLTRVGFGRLACLDADGYPYIVPLLVHYRDGGFYIGARERSAWRAFLQRDGRVCLNLQDGEQRAQVKGNAELIEGPVIGASKLESLWVERAQRDGWLDDPGVQAYYHNIYTHEPMYGFFIRPIKITSWQGGEWAKRYKHADW